MSCDTCLSDLNGDGVLKQPCGHRIHKKCESEDGQCSSCKVEAARDNHIFQLLLLMAGLAVGLMTGFFINYKPDSIYQSIREVQHNLIKMEKFADQSMLTRLAVDVSLKRIKAAVEMEMMVLVRNNNNK